MIYLRIGTRIWAGWCSLALAIALPLSAQEQHPEALTANDLADALSVYWWTVKLPPDFAPGDTIGVEAISSDGKNLAGGGGFSSSTNKGLGGSLRIFCWEDRAMHQTVILLKTAAGDRAEMYLKDYFNNAAYGGPSNGAVLQVGDILIKFDSSKSPSLTGGNFLSPSQVGLRTVITHRK